MKMTPRNFRNGLAGLALCLASSFSLNAQSTLHCLEDGAWLPVYEVRGGAPYCFTGDGLLKSAPEKLTMLSNTHFSDGYLEVEILENIRSGVVTSDGAPRFTSDRGWFQFAARVTASEDITDAYFIMRYDRLGEAAYSVKSIGDIKAGKSKLITLFKKLDYEMPEQLHFYSGMEEIRSNLVPASYTYKFGDFFLESAEAATKSDLVAAAH